MTNETKELIKSYLEENISDNMEKELKPYLLDAVDCQLLPSNNIPNGSWCF